MSPAHASYHQFHRIIGQFKLEGTSRRDQTPLVNCCTADYNFRNEVPKRLDMCILLTSKSNACLLHAYTIRRKLGKL